MFPDVANLPLRDPAMMAKQAASLDALLGGRFELGLGAGACWKAIGATGGPIGSGDERAITVKDEYYSVRGLHPGPAPAHPIEIWLGVGKPRALALTGRLTGG